MTAFVILAAGKGTRVGRVGEKLHKALLPLDGRAVLSHLFDLAPPDAHLVVVIGDRSEQIIDYVMLAHPGLRVEFVTDRNPRGPGASLLTAREVVGNDDLVFTSCDTLWEPDDELWKDPRSWVGVAPVPAGTDPERWCRIDVYPHSSDRVRMVLDKCPGGSSQASAYVGLARISAADLPVFWEGVTDAGRINGELQVSGGFDALLNRDLEGRDEPECDLRAQRVHWTDVGDEAGYRHAVARTSGYDWTKLDQATYVLEPERRVIKYAADGAMIGRRYARAVQLGEDVVPQTISQRGDFLAYMYVQGKTAYDATEDDGEDVTRYLLDWFTNTMWHRRIHPSKIGAVRAAMQFYKDKTITRARMLPDPLQREAVDAITRIGYFELAGGVIPGLWHGDLNHGNVIITAFGTFRGIDWREDFAGETGWGDLRYDVAKLLAGTIVHWGRARRGDFRPWEDGAQHAAIIRSWIYDHVPDQARSIEIIGALSLLNSAPLHAEPLDAILVARGTAWLEEVL